MRSSPLAEPLPSVGAQEIIGLAEIVHDRNGRMDVFKLDGLTHYEFGHTLAVVKAGEMLGLLDTPKNMVVLTGLGGELVHADINGRKANWNRQLRKLGTFRMLIQILEKAKDKRLPADVVREELIFRLPTEDFQGLFKTVIRWGRFAELIGYDPDSEVVYLVEQPVPAA